MKKVEWQNLEQWTFKIPEGTYNFQVPIYRRIGDTVEVEIKPKECVHQWIDVGFMHTKLVCKHCNKDQK
mgnify:CR=1 FL=1